MATVILGLGTNQGDKVRHLQNAVSALKAHLEYLRCSQVFESPALLAEAAPPEWNIPFLNMAVCGETRLAPAALLEETQKIEQALGRVQRGHWGPREIDIDILAYDEELLALPGLVIPHPQLTRRDFALIPLAQLAPDWRHPKERKPARELSATMDSQLVLTGVIIT